MCLYHVLELLPLGHAADLLVRLHEGLLDGGLELLVARGRLHLLRPHFGQDVLVQPRLAVVRHLRPAVPVEHAEVDPELLHGLVRHEPVLAEGVLSGSTFDFWGREGDTRERRTGALELENA